MFEPMQPLTMVEGDVSHKGEWDISFFFADDLRNGDFERQFVESCRHAQRSEFRDKIW